MTPRPRNWRSFLAALSPLVLVWLGACSDATAPAGPPPIVSKAVVDGAHGGTPGFFFLPPLSQDPTGTGAFDSTLAGRLTVEVCPIQNGQCGAPVSVFSDTTSEPIVSQTLLGRYTVTWRTAGLALTPGTTYRIRTLIDGDELGYADVDLLPQGAPTDAVGVPDGEALSIVFRVDRGAVDGTIIDVSDGPAVTGLVKSLRVQVTPGAPIEVEYWTSGETRWLVTRGAGAAQDVLLARLLPGRSYSYRVRALTPGLGNPTFDGTFVSDTLPTELQNVGLQATGTTSASLVMLELQPPTFQGYVAIDDQSRVVWYHPSVGAPRGWTRGNNGNFVLLDTNDGLREVTPGGSVVGRVQHSRVLNQVIHHDVVATPQNTFYFLTREPRLFGGVTWTGEAIWEWDPSTDQLVQRWSALDFLSPATDIGPRSTTLDWIHANALSIGVSGNIIMSSPFLNQVIAILPDFSGLAWRLGGVNASITVDSAGTFNFQHSTAEIAAGRVLMFDNRRDSLHDGQVYSRALELAVDHSTQSATLAWQFRPPNDNYSTIISSARRMPNGNTMVAFGAGDGLRGSIGPIEVYEVAPGGAIVWHLVLSGPGSTYRATPFGQIAGEVAAN